MRKTIGLTLLVWAKRLLHPLGIAVHAIDVQELEEILYARSEIYTRALRHLTKKGDEQIIEIGARGGQKRWVQ